MIEGRSPESPVCYDRWRDNHRSVLAALPGKRVFVLFSGGKDSSLALTLMAKAGEEFGFPLEVHSGAFPVHRYTPKQIRSLDAHWKEQGIDISWHRIEKTDSSLEQAPNPCLACQSLRKKVLQQILAETVEDWNDLVLVTSYSLWDLVSYALEHILDDEFPGASSKGQGRSERFLETGQRFYPVLQMKEGYTVFRPLIRYNGSEIHRAVVETGTPLLSVPCKFKEFRPKRILERYYEEMSSRFDYDRVFAFAKEHLGLQAESDYSLIEKEEYLSRIF